MEEVILLPSVKDKLKNLVFVLYEKEYFSFIENAENYVIAIYDFIYTIPSLKRRRTKNKKHGEYYCKYKPNKKTTWYITFDTEDDIYLVRNITNNHSKDYTRFISGI